MFKKDDYIVLIDHFSNSFQRNYIFKQREPFPYLRDYLDNTLVNNGRSDINNKSGINRSWRYATKNEIDYYDLIGKPFDTTSNEFLNYKSKPDDLSCLVKILEGIKNE